VSRIEPSARRTSFSLSWMDHDVHALTTPGERPHTCDHVGLAFDRAQVRFFDESGQAVS
jgi:hypothetical protein